MGRKRGIALGVTIGIVVILFLAGYTIIHLSQGVQRQLEYSDSVIRAQYIAESGINALVARLMARPWEERWFSPGGKAGSQIPFGGGVYDYFIQDTPNRDFQVDIWVRSNYREAKRAYFWRIKFDPNLFKGILEGLIAGALETDPEKHPTSAPQAAPLSEDMDKNIAKRDSNHSKSEAISSNVRKTTDANEALREIGVSDGSIGRSGSSGKPDAPTGITPSSPKAVTSLFEGIPSKFYPKGDLEDFLVAETPKKTHEPPPDRVAAKGEPVEGLGNPPPAPGLPPKVPGGPGVPGVPNGPPPQAPENFGRKVTSRDGVANTNPIDAEASPIPVKPGVETNGTKEDGPNAKAEEKTNIEERNPKKPGENDSDQ